MQVWQGLLKFSKNYLNVDLRITPFFKNKHFELCCFVMYRVRNIVNKRESDVICHSVRRSRAPTSCVRHYNCIRQVVKYMFWHYEHFWPINRWNFIEINVINHYIGWLLLVKDIHNHFFNHIIYCNCIRQVVKYMFWHYEHFWPIYFIEMSVLNHEVDYQF